jgi:hypothetical protein
MGKLYDPKLYSLVIAGIPIPAKGYADGEFIKLERDAQAYTDYAGTSGDVTRVRQHDKRATLTFTTAQEADINAVLSTLHAADQNADNGAGIGPFLLKNREGLTLHGAKECWIAKLPDVTLDKGITARAWMIRIAELSSFEGG